MAAAIRLSAEFIRDAAMQAGVRAAMKKVGGRIATGAQKEYAKQNLKPNITVEEGVRPGTGAGGFKRPYVNVVVDDPKAEYGDSRRPPVRALLKAGEAYS